MNSRFESLSIIERGKFSIKINYTFLSDPLHPIPEEILTNICHIDFHGEFYVGEWERICEQLSQFPNLETVAMSDSSALDSLEQAELLKRKYPQIQWKRLRLRDKSLCIENASLISFVRSNPHIEELLIEGQITLLDDQLLGLLIDKTFLKRIFINANSKNEIAAKYKTAAFMRSRVPPIESVYIKIENAVYLHFGSEAIQIEKINPTPWDGDYYLKEFPNLKSLYLKMGALALPLESLIEMLKRWPHLTSLSLPNHNLTDEYLNEIGKHAPQLELLGLYKNTNLNMLALKDLLMKCTEMKNLDIGHCTQFSDSDIQALFHTSRPFERLWLDNTHISLDTLAKAIRACPLLKEIIISTKTEYVDLISKKFPYLMIMERI